MFDANWSHWWMASHKSMQNGTFSPVTISPCACCHLAVLCLQSYSVHLSNTIYGMQFCCVARELQLHELFPLFFFFFPVCDACSTWTHPEQNFWPSVKMRWKVTFLHLLLHFSINACTLLTTFHASILLLLLFFFLDSKISCFVSIFPSLCLIQ